MPRPRRRSAIAASVVGLAAGCSSAPPPSHVASPHGRPGATLGPATDPAIPGVWIDTDAPPKGARYRIGSRAMTGSELVAIADDGTVASYDPDRGLFEARADGKIRVVPIADCLPSVLRYVGSDLVGACGPGRFRRRGGTIELKPLPCNEGEVAISNDGAWLACAELGEHTTLSVVRMQSGETTRATLHEHAEEILVTNDGVAVVTDGKKALIGVERGAAAWRRPGRHEHLGYDAASDRLVTWSSDDHHFAVFKARTGAPIVTFTAGDLEVTRPLEITPDGAAWAVLTQGRAPALLLVDARDRSVISSWPTRIDARALAVSPAGRFAALLDERIVVVDLKKPHPPSPDDKPETAPGIATIVSSRSGDRMGILDRHGALQIVDARAGAVIARGDAAPWALPEPPLAFSPDASRIVLSTENGDLRIADARTLQTVCVTRDVFPGTWLHWGERGIFSIYPGQMEREAQTRAGFIDVLTPTCERLEVKDHTSIVGVVRADRSSVTLAFKEPDLMMLGRQVSVRRLDLRTGALVDVSATATAADMRAAEDALSPVSPARATAVAGDESWFAVADGPTVVVYPCSAPCQPLGSTQTSL